MDQQLASSKQTLAAPTPAQSRDSAAPDRGGQVIFEAPDAASPRRPQARVVTPWARRALRLTADSLNGLISWALLGLTSAIAFVLFRVLNRTHVHGRHNFGMQKNTLLCSNHRTMIDSYMVGHLSSWPWAWIMPWKAPYHPAAAENFFGNKLLAWFSARWKCIPVRRGKRDFGALSCMEEALPKGQMLIFPEGTRSRTGELLPGRPGTGKLIYDTRCKVVPIYHHGMSEVLPIGQRWPRLFRRIDVYVGPAVDLGDLLDLPPGKETSQQVIDRVMAAIGQLRDQAEAAAAAHRPWLTKLRRAVLRN